ncbi:MAG: hypothetical protein ACREA2_17580 [Blastocatellia bacterium]
MSIIQKEIEGPLLPWLEQVSLFVACLVMIAAFARLWRENAGAGVDLFWWFARLGLVFAMLGSGPRIVDAMAKIGRDISEGSNKSGVLYTFCKKQRDNFDEAYKKFTNGTFKVQGVPRQLSASGEAGVTLNVESFMADPIRKLAEISTSMPLLLASLNVSRGVITFGDLFLTMLSSVLMIAMRLAAPVMIALAIDRSMAQRVTYPYLWGVVVLTLVWPMVVLIIKAIAYMGGNIAMALGDGAPAYLFDARTMAIIQNGDQQPIYTILFAAVIMLISGLSLWGAPYIAYQLSVGGVYDSVSQTISSWAGQFRSGSLYNMLPQNSQRPGPQQQTPQIPGSWSWPNRVPPLNRPTILNPYALPNKFVPNGDSQGANLADNLPGGLGSIKSRSLRA